MMVDVTSGKHKGTDFSENFDRLGNGFPLGITMMDIAYARKIWSSASVILVVDSVPIGISPTSRSCKTQSARSTDFVGGGKFVAGPPAAPVKLLPRKWC